MIKYEIIEGIVTLGYDNRNKIVKGCTLNYINAVTNVVESYDTKAEAEKEFKKYETVIKPYGSGKLVLYTIREFYLQKNLYYENEDYFECKQLYKFSPIIIRIVEAESKRVLRTVSDFKKAEKVKAMLERKNNAKHMLSFND